MSNSLGNVYNYITSSSLATKAYNEASSVAECVISNPITTIGLVGIVWVASIMGQLTSIATKKHVELNTLIPKSARNRFRRCGEELADFNERISNLISKVLPFKKEFIHLVISAPIFEELLFRMPLLITSWKIDDLSSEFLSSSLLDGMVDATGAQVIKVALAVLSSIVFTYAHGDNLDSGRATELFVGGLALSHLLLRLEGGLECAIIAHIIYNLFLYLMGSKNSSGIPLRRIKEECIVLDV